jgi:hypothetical protein
MSRPRAGALRGPRNLAPHLRLGRGGQPAGRGAGTSCPWRGGGADLGSGRGFHDESSRQDEASQLRVAELSQVPEKVSIEGFLREPFAWTKVAADERDREAGLKRSGEEGEQATFAPSGYAYGQPVAPPGPDVYGSPRLLHLVADRVTAQREGLPVDPFAMGLVS